MTGANAHCSREGRSGRGRPLRPKANEINRLRMSQALGLAAVVMAGNGTGNIPTVLSTSYGETERLESNLNKVTIPNEFNCIIVIPLYLQIYSSGIKPGPCIGGFGMFTSLSDNLTFSASIVTITTNGSTSYSGTIYGYVNAQEYAPHTKYSGSNYSISSTIFVF